jgi:hypothetical protein
MLIPVPLRLEPTKGGAVFRVVPQAEHPGPLASTDQGKIPAWAWQPVPGLAGQTLAEAPGSAVEPARG